MTRISYYAAILCALALGACNDQEQPTSPSPEFKNTPPPDPLVCNFDSVKSLANSYFSPPAQQQALALETAMEPTAQSDAARENGFKLLDLMGTASRSASPPSSTVGGRLARATIKCMFDAHGAQYAALANGQGLDAVRFDLALGKASGGVFYPVGDSFPTAPQVLKGTVNGVAVSKAAPGPATGTFPNVTLGSWSGILSSPNALIYGYQVSAIPLVYEWATIEPSVTFTPYALVSVCSGTTDDLMVQESGLGVLSFDTANLCDLPGDATGRTATGFRSQFSNKSVTKLSLTFDPGPPSTWPLASQHHISVDVSVPGNTPGSTLGVLGVCVYVTLSANNGTPTNVTSDLSQSRDLDCNAPPTGAGSPYLSVKTTLASGAQYSVADFGNVSITKTGGARFTVTADVIDRSGGGTLIKKINVTP